MTFKSDMAKFKAHLQHNVKSAHVAIGEAFLGNIINATPVDFLLLFAIGYLVIIVALIVPSIGVLRYQPKEILSGKE